MTDRTNASALNRGAASARSFQQIQQRSIQIPSRIPRSATPASVRVAVIMGGNTIDPGAVDGIAYAVSAPASIPDYDPTALPATVHGVGVAFDIIAQEYLLIAHYGDIALFQRDVFEGAKILLGRTVTLPITSGGGATKTLYPILGLT